MLYDSLRAISKGLKTKYGVSSRFAYGAIVTASLSLVWQRQKKANSDTQMINNMQDSLLFRVNERPILTTNLTSCDFISRTIRTMENTRTKESLRSKYNVQWRRPLGEGGFGTVYLATDRKTKELVAVKKIPKKATDDHAFQREMNAFLHVRQKGGHPNICELKENFDEGDCYYLVLDLISGGEMFHYFINNGAFSEADAARLIREVGSALAFLHGVNVVHGDLKPENLMLSSENFLGAVIKLVDFGCAQILDEKSPFYEETTYVAAVTPGYSPPELVDKNKKLTHLQPSMDMFAVGVILYVMLCGVHPFDLDGTATDEELQRWVMSKEGPPLRKSPLTKHLSRSAIDAIEKLMNPNPKKRLTAQQMLEHPWVRGETARKGKIAGSDQRLSSYRKYKSRLEAKVFQNMVELSAGLNGDEISKRTSLIEHSFHKLDPDNKGYITKKELKQLDPHESETDIALPEDDSQLSLSGFSDLLSENMKNRYFPAGHLVYREGDKGNEMYFINSGRIEVSTRDGFKTVMGQGNFFGEGALLSKTGKRSASIRSITPVHTLEISRQYFEKYLADGYDTHLSLREKDKARKRERAKTILASTKNMREERYCKGAYFYKQGEQGDELFIIESGEADVTVSKHVVFTLKPGELCGEHGAVFKKPRNTSAQCVSRECVVHVMKANDFHKIVDASSSLEESIRDISLRREFQKALVFATKKAFPSNESELRAAFHAADSNQSGCITLSDISSMLKHMDSTFTDKDIKAIMEALDLDGSGSITWGEFKRLFGMAAVSS